ncbi:AAA family ATPase [Aquirufa ecclesiirivi]|uniref:AAA family ATPase n=1 Tax=Aquirufa ecclesiirivi TaxID=2715124 RepID=UPI003BAF0536
MMNDVQLAKSFVKDFQRIKTAVAERIVGQDEIIDLLLISLFCEGHCLLVGVPGLAKTRLVHTVAALTDLEFRRIQFTPDLMPSDIIGAEVMDAQRNFVFNRGPIFSNIVLADEINRTPPKTQSALLEAMQEETVSVAGESYPLPKPFFVLATQNPIEQEGTYPLPEAQLDRFLFMLVLDYPSYEEEVAVVRMSEKSNVETLPASILNAHTLLEYQQLVKRVPVPDHVVETAVKWVHQTRPNSALATDVTNSYISWGAGPRASQNLILAAKCRALLQGRFSPNVEDVRAVAVPVLQHRIILNYKAESQGLNAAEVVRKIVM